MDKFVSYCRVSTTRQGESGLGLEAQQRAVNAFCKNGDIIAEFVEIESGRNNKRPKLKEAIEICKKEDATLIVANLSRLSRNVLFTATLMETAVKFKAIDNPNADNFTIGLMALLAEKEAKDISQRTKAALTSLKIRGVKLGNPKCLNQKYAKELAQYAVSFREYSKPDPMILSLILSLRKQRKTQHQIVAELEKAGKKVSVTTVHRYINKYYQA